MLEFRILGPLEAADERGPVRLGGPMQRATLALLLLNANRVVPVERLADDLYAGAAPVTAVTQVQRQISELRKALGAPSVIHTQAPGYVLRLAPDQLDLGRFERLAGEGSRALARGEAVRAAQLLDEALALWRGAPLVDFVHESFAQVPIERLEEVRLAAVEQRNEARLALGHHLQLVGELEALVAEHPLREQLRGQLMLALYRSGRQAEALDVYRGTREELVTEFGIEPSRALQQLERAILRQDPSLDLERASPAHVAIEADRTLLVVASADERVDSLLAIAEPLASVPERELIVMRLLEDEAELAPSVAKLNARRLALAVRARTAAFTAVGLADEVVRLATAYDVELVLLDAGAGLGANGLPDDVGALLERSPADVAFLWGSPQLAGGEGVFVPFGGGEHDWTALELGAWLAAATEAPLRLIGTRSDPQSGRRDASRLLADASLAVQRVVGVDAEPVLADPTGESLVAAVESATAIVVGMSPRWRQEGLGAARRALVHARPPVLLVHHGPRPSGLAPPESRTRFTWSLES